MALDKAPPTAVAAADADIVIPILAAELSEDDELRVLAERWLADPTTLGRRARDIAVEIARRVAALRGYDVDHPDR